MPETAPAKAELENLLGHDAFGAWQELTEWIERNYAMEPLWNDGGKAGRYELKFRRSGKTLCTLYVREGRFAFVVIYGAKEREVFESRRKDFPEAVGAIYDETRTYHDGKWILIEAKDSTMIPVFETMIAIKKKPRLEAR